MLIKENNTPQYTYLNIKEGQIWYKKEGKIETFASLKGTIQNVEFFMDEIKGEKKEKAKFYFSHPSTPEIYILQMGTSSGYFRALCNCLKSGKPKEEITVTPAVKNEKPTCFVEQDKKYLKHYFTKDFNGKDGDTLPDLVIVKVGTKQVTDNTEQVIYWKNWLKNTYENESK